MGHANFTFMFQTLTSQDSSCVAREWLLHWMPTVASSHRVATTLLGAAFTASVWACGSGDTSDIHTYGGGEPAHAVPTRDAGGSSSSGGSGGSGSGANPSSTEGDGSTPGFGNIMVASFTLIDTSITTVPDGSPVLNYDPIPYGATIDLALVGHSLSIRANPPQVSEIGSMAFALDATFTYTANTAPFSLCGDDDKGKFTSCLFSEEKHVLTVTIYPQEQLQGTPYPPTTFEFTVIDSAADAGTD